LLDNNGNPTGVNRDNPFRGIYLRGGTGCLSGNTLIEGVPAKDLVGESIEVQTMGGRIMSDPVFLKGQADLYEVTAANGRSITVTLDHKFYSGGQWVKLRDLRVGSVLRGAKEVDGELFHHGTMIVEIRYVRHDDFYDLHVPIANHYLAHGFWNHNSGKTQTGAAIFCERRRIDPAAQCLITSNSYPQLQRSTLVGLVQYCERHNVPIRPYKGNAKETARSIAYNKYCYIWDAWVDVISADNFMTGSETARGMEVRDIWYDEAAYGTRDGIDTMATRMPRGPGNLPGMFLFTSSINKHDVFNFMYSLFDDPDRDDNLKELYKSFCCSVRENPHVPDGYVEFQEAQLTADLVTIEVDGQYVAIAEGRVYPNFDRVLNDCKDVVQDGDRLAGMR